MVVDKTAPKIPTITLDDTKQIVTIISDQVDKDISNVEYSFDNNNWVKYTEPFSVSSNTKVYARSTDFAGNISDISNLDINDIDKTPPVISIDGIENGGNYYNIANAKISVN